MLIVLIVVVYQLPKDFHTHTTVLFLNFFLKQCGDDYFEKIFGEKAINGLEEFGGVWNVAKLLESLLLYC